MMKVYYCEHCERYKYSNRLKSNECHICGNELKQVQVDFLEFSNMNKEEREAKIKESC